MSWCPMQKSKLEMEIPSASSLWANSLTLFQKANIEGSTHFARIRSFLFTHGFVNY